MNIALPKDLEDVIREQVKTGSYATVDEAVCDAVRRTFCEFLDIEKDTPELAQLLREGMNSRHTPYRKGDLHELLKKARRDLGK